MAGKKIFKAEGEPVNATDRMNVHSIAVQVPLDRVRRRANRYGAGDRASVIGVWTSASRRQVRVLGDRGGADTATGPFTQVSRLGNPLFNEVIVPMSKKDLWNSLPPSEDKRFAQFVEQPELAALLPALYPNVFPNLDRLTKAKKARADLVAILLTGVPAGLIDGFTNATGEVQADMLRLNTAIPPTPSGPVRGARWGPGRIPERAEGRRRRGQHRVAGDRRGDRPAGGQGVPPGRGGRRGHPGVERRRRDRTVP